MISQIIGCCALQVFEGRTDLAAKMANTATGGGRYLPGHQRILQLPKVPLISRRHQPARIQAQNSIKREIANNTLLQVKIDAGDLTSPD
jgi:hypothetical protein